MSRLFIVRICYFEAKGHSPDREDWFKRVLEKHFPDLWHYRSGYIFCLRYCEVDATGATQAGLDTLLVKKVCEIDDKIALDAAILGCILGRGVEVSILPSEAIWILYHKSLRANAQGFFKKHRWSAKYEAVNPANSLTAKQRLLARPEAARLLSEALLAGSPSGQLIGYVRVFEAAFKMKHNKLKAALHRFLQTGQLEICKRVSDSWIEARHGVSHALDPTKNLFSDDVRQSVPLCRMATFDVVINKEDWAGTTHSRFHIDGLATKVTSKGDMKLTVGHYMMASLMEIDPLGRFQISTFSSIFGFNLSLNIRGFLDWRGLDREEQEEFEAVNAFGADTIRFYSDWKGEAVELEDCQLPINLRPSKSA